MATVINRNDFQIVGRYAGEDYVFDPQVPLVLPDEAAAHILGLGEPQDFIDAVNRLGLKKEALGKLQIVRETPKEIGSTHGTERIHKRPAKPSA